MSLSLKIISFKGQISNVGEEAIFNRQGGTIGRADENTLVLPDPEKFVSRRHAAISFENGHYLIKDSSLSGTYIDDQEPPLNNALHKLADGMRLRIGEYEILVSITPEQPDDSAFDPDPFSAVPATENPIYPPNLLVPGDDVFDSSAHDNADLDAFFRDTGATSLKTHDDLPYSGSAKGQPELDSLMQADISTIHDSFIPPAPVGSSQDSSEIPDDFNFEDLFNAGTDTEDDEDSWFQGLELEPTEDLPPVVTEAGLVIEAAKEPSAPPVSIDPILHSSASMQEMPPISVQAQPVDQALASSELFNVFLQGAGIESKELQAQATPETVRRMGLMFRKFVEGTMAVLRSRAEFKSQFRVNVTTIKTTNNNPLKFTVTAEDALTLLIKNGQSGFKDSVEAIDEGFHDIMSHQLAMQAGIQASLEQILRQFDPKRIEKQFEERLVLKKKSKYWDKYSVLYPHVVEQAMEEFFGDAFAEAYDKQMKQLNKLRKDK
jgi:type VI secretion system protein